MLHTTSGELPKASFKKIGEREREMVSCALPAASADGTSVFSSWSRTTQGASQSRAINFQIAPPKPQFLLLSSTISRLNSKRSSSIVANSKFNEVNDSRERLQPAARAASLALYALVVLYHGLYLLCSKVACGSSNDSAAAEQKADAAEQVAEQAISPPTPMEAATDFMIQVSNLVELVDSRDIIELQLKKQDSEIIIRKKEAIFHQIAQTPLIMMQSNSQPLPNLHVEPSSPGPAPAAAIARSVKPSHPPLKSPMAGTFYRSPGPGQSPFVKVGDKVIKGQVLCIIEAMKLMNEIEADQGGTVVEILAEDAKPVSLDQPLFRIES